MAVAIDPLRWKTLFALESFARVSWTLTFWPGSTMRELFRSLNRLSDCCAMLLNVSHIQPHGNPVPTAIARLNPVLLQ